MALEQEQTREILGSHIPSGEELKASAVRQGKVTAVTDRRVLSVTENERGNDQQREVESVLLTSDTILGTSYGENVNKDNATVQHFAGITFAIIGLLLVPMGLTGNGSDQGAFLLIGLIAIAVGIYLFWSAEGTTDGSVSITLRREGEIPDRTWTFSRGQTEVPQAISEQVASIHSPE